MKDYIPVQVTHFSGRGGVFITSEGGKSTGVVVLISRRNNILPSTSGDIENLLPIDLTLSNSLNKIRDKTTKGHQPFGSAKQVSAKVVRCI